MTMVAVVPVRAGRSRGRRRRVRGRGDGHAVVIGDGTEMAALELAGVATTTVRAMRDPVVRPGGMGRGAGHRGPRRRRGGAARFGRRPRPRAAPGRRAGPPAAGRCRRRDRPMAPSWPARAASSSRRSIADGPFVATLQPGVRGVEPVVPAGPVLVDALSWDAADAPAPARRRGARGPTPRRGHDGPGRSGRASCGGRRTGRTRPVPAARTRRRRPRGVGGRDPRGDRPRLARPRAPDRHDRRGRGPRPVRGVRHQRRRAAHQRARPTRPHRQREHSTRTAR